MKRSELHQKVKSLLVDAAMILANSYDCYYPKSGGRKARDPNGRDISTAFALATKMGGLDWPVFTEVPVNQGRDGRKERVIDMLMLPRTQSNEIPSSAILIESKNVFKLARYDTIKSDFEKMDKFSGENFQNNTKFPATRLHLALMMAWGSQGELSEKLLNLDFANSQEDERPILEKIPRNLPNKDEQWLIGLCRWAGPWS